MCLTYVDMGDKNEKSMVFVRKYIAVDHLEILECFVLFILLTTIEFLIFFFNVWFTI